MVFSDYRVSPNFLVVLGLRLWLRLGLGCDNKLCFQDIALFSCFHVVLSLWWGGGGGGGGFLVITVSHPTFCCVGVGLWLRWGWAVTIIGFTPYFPNYMNLPP